MNRDEFVKLPPAVALGMLWDALEDSIGHLLFPIEAPRVPFAPKFDMTLPRKDRQYVYASESELGSLVYYRDKFRASTGQWAEKDHKKADQLDRWIAWREWFPADRWQGVRGNDAVTAEAPSRKPALHAYGPRAQAATTHAADEEQGDDPLPF